MLLIHGGNFGRYCLADDWGPVIGPLAETYRVLAIDKIGCGFTDNPPTDADYVIGSVVQHGIDFLAALGIERAHLMGHSRGGYATTRIALERPDLALSLVIVDSSTLMTPPNPQYDAWDREAAALPDMRDQVRYLVTVNSFGGDHVDDDFVDGDGDSGVAAEVAGGAREVDGRARAAVRPGPRRAPAGGAGHDPLGRVALPDAGHLGLQ